MRCLFALPLAAIGVAAAAAPAPGRYEATLCVSASASAPPSCGAAELEVRSATRAEVRVADIVYRLSLRPAQVDVTTLHGRMQIDEFSAEYAWQGDVLSFIDTDKQARYEVRTGARLGRAR
ncbi:MAG: hypothetical protein K8R60_15925 [Burkholderiales bacterium]|nr:hypothetical protein [Burkholderiales bacterium]